MSNSLNFQIGAETAKLRSALSKASSEIKDFADRNKERFEQVGASITKMGDKVKYVSLAFSASGALAVKSFADVDKGLREVNTLLGITGEEADKNFTKLQKLAKDASKEVGLLQTEISKGLYNAISAGVPQENAFNFIVTAGKAAIGGVTDLNTAVDGMTTVINAFGKSFEEAEAVSDSMFATVQGGKTTFEELSAALFNIAPAAAASKVAMEEVNAGIATLTASGTPTNVATTQMRAALVGLQRPSEALNAIFQSVGYESAQLAIEAEGLQFALQKVKDSTNGNNGALQELLGSVEAVQAANVLAGTGAAKFAEEMERQANAAGASEKAFLELEKSLPRQWERLKVQLSNITIEIGQKLAPVVAKITQYLTALTEKWDNLSEGTKTAIVVIGGLVAAAGPLLLALGTLIKFLPIILSGLSLLTGPIGLIVLGIAALTAVVVKNWSTIKKWVQDLVNYFIDIYNESLIVRVGVETIVMAFKNMFAVGKFVLNALWSIIKYFASGVSASFKAVGSIIKGVLTLNVNEIKRGFAQYQETAKDSMDTLISNVKGGWEEMTETITDNTQKAINNILSGKKEHVTFETAKESTDKLESDIAKATEKGVVEGLNNGLQGRERQESVVSSGMQTQGASVGAPSAPVFEEMLRPTMMAIDEKFKFLQTLLWEFQHNAQMLIEGSIADTFGNLGDAIGDALTGGGNAVQKIGGALLQSMGRFLSDFGKMMIQYGTAALFFDKVKQSLASGKAPFAAAALIAAGVALTAVGSAIQKQQAGGLDGGGASASTPDVRSNSTFVSTANQDNQFVFRISGNDLVSIVDRNRRNLQRIG